MKVKGLTWLISASLLCQACQVVPQAPATDPPQPRPLTVAAQTGAPLLAQVEAPSAPTPGAQGSDTDEVREKPAKNPDPFEPVNRVFWRFNRALDKAILLPVAKGFLWLPSPVRTGVYNFIGYLDLPISFLSNILQGKFLGAGKDLSRFSINTVFGVFGFIDTAAYMGIPRKMEDFNQAFGVWGIPNGPYLMVPFFGPYVLREGVGDILELPFSLDALLDWPFEARLALWAVDGVETRSRFVDLEPILESSADEYIFIREFYLQFIESRVRDGELVEPETQEEDKELEEFMEEIEGL